MELREKLGLEDDQILVVPHGLVLRAADGYSAYLDGLYIYKMWWHILTGDKSTYKHFVTDEIRDALAKACNLDTSRGQLGGKKDGTKHRHWVPEEVMQGIREYRAVVRPDLEDDTPVFGLVQHRGWSAHPLPVCVQLLEFEDL